ncbi:exodeoxyribonuclease V subunit alpha [Parendozoicomonas haliclonae]|uniref:RecBCD enzyme subunit RecD n=1 Tax=Parendozoicomonas haliclonae TaxID=1960125 RepID=A0A1X7AKG7_9GAMM|nr:exodeoxyribonuclease V subunit alpha [Parendozoicomonas haliclonae]SMA47144.1 RecBCD enzyme subunit RecD [Parendozoicomonas haliclonae]
MLNALRQLADQNIIRPLDYHFARFLAAEHDDPVLLLAAALTSLQLGHGHTCLELNQDSLELLGTGRNLEAIRNCPSITSWATHLQTLAAVGDGHQATPLVLDNGRLYLMRYWQYEASIAYRMNHNRVIEHDTARTRAILERLFAGSGEGQTINWQMVAAAVAASRKISVISGGPGTGKTTTVTRLLALLVELAHIKDPYRNPTIHLAAPTGKAAARLTESIGSAKWKLDCEDVVRHAITDQASTIHRLLGVIPGKAEFRHNRENPLHLDILVVDEASMIDSSLMSRLLDALPDHAQLILLGDRDQLASVEAGSVLGDICSAMDFGYSPEQVQALQQLTGAALMEHIKAHGPTIRDGLCLLRKSYRFDEKSGIGLLARAVNTQNKAEVNNLAGEQRDDLQFCYSGDIQQQLLNEAIAGYRGYLEKVRGEAPAEEILEAFDQFQVLCALREGPQGVSGLNDSIRKALTKAGLIEAGDNDTWYPGRPVLITRNDPALELYNGDIGITVKQDGRYRVIFPKANGEPRFLLPSRLPEHDTVFAMTVHKSQGSEFDRVLLVMPDTPSPVLTRELLYTGITRAKSSLMLFSKPDILTSAVDRPVQRVTGLADRLQ